MWFLQLIHNFHVVSFTLCKYIGAKIKQGILNLTNHEMDVRLISILFWKYFYFNVIVVITK